MKFYSNEKKLTVWDAKKNKPLCVFEGGVFETEDKKIAEKLQLLGYKYEGDFVETQSEKDDTQKAKNETAEKK